MKRWGLLWIVGLLSCLLVAPAAAQEWITPPGVFTDPNWLRIDFHRVNVAITDQVATTDVDLQFTNTGDALAEGTFLFPLPEGAAVDQLTMIIDGIAYEAKILAADEARNIYNEIVRQYRDPALLEYVGTSVIQANVFPIPAGESRRIQITYSHLLEAENGLIAYHYPMSGRRVVQSTSISVQVNATQPISAIYSPSHNVAILREGETAFRASYESAGPATGTDFSLYYSFEQDLITTNLLTYRESATEDGFFLLLVQPPLQVDTTAIVPKDIILVIDQSGSMEGEKWAQAQAAAAYVLNNLNENDRFNVVVFSSGTRIYSNSMVFASEAQGAIDWINGLIAEGGTNISDSLLQALNLAETERPTTVLFMTDGEATEGIIETERIIEALKGAAKPNARIFTFGIGDTVNTILLDSIVREFRGSGSYVRPGQRIDEIVASLYNKISAPVLTDVTLTIDGVVAELMYPTRLSDLFAGEQITLVGRYRGATQNATITLTGNVNGETRTFVYDQLVFGDLAGGESFIARLWATRRIGDLLNTIRINGENPELVDTIVDLSLRYGIITPYTSFLIEEDDILTQQGRDRAMEEAEADFAGMSNEASGAAAVTRAQDLNQMGQAAAPMPSATAAPTMSAPASGGENAPTDDIDTPNQVITVESKTFIQIEGVWTDTLFKPDEMETQKIVFLSDDYFNLIAENPELAAYFAIGERVIVMLDGIAYEVIIE
ncbi:MAG: VWA domain-containing protein [Anaerolineae bacterium]|jgi:Ca-activated chloride channel family protein|nr:VWA domain-containing protein [Anaerolineae bacterium]